MAASFSAGYHIARRYSHAFETCPWIITILRRRVRPIGTFIRYREISGNKTAIKASTIEMIMIAAIKIASRL